MYLAVTERFSCPVSVIVVRLSLALCGLESDHACWNRSMLMADSILCRGASRAVVVAAPTRCATATRSPPARRSPMSRWSPTPRPAGLSKLVRRRGATVDLHRAEGVCAPVIAVSVPCDPVSGSNSGYDEGDTPGRVTQHAASAHRQAANTATGAAGPRADRDAAGRAAPPRGTPPPHGLIGLGYRCPAGRRRRVHRHRPVGRS